MNLDRRYRLAIRDILNRYIVMVQHKDEKVLEEFMMECLDQTFQGASLMKMNRWLGYIQGRVITKGYTTVEAERDFTRPFLRPLDEEIEQSALLQDQVQL